MDITIHDVKGLEIKKSEVRKMEKTGEPYVVTYIKIRTGDSFRDESTITLFSKAPLV